MTAQVAQTATQSSRRGRAANTASSGSKLLHVEVVTTPELDRSTVLGTGSRRRRRIASVLRARKRKSGRRRRTENTRATLRRAPGAGSSVAGAGFAAKL